MGSVGIGSCNIIDIREGDLDFDLAGEIHALLNPSSGQERQLPTLLLYDEPGLKIFEEITYLDEYYLTNAEIQVLEEHANSIAALIPQDAQLIELGSGNLRKVDILLKALDKAGKAVDYYALDLSKPELERTLDAVTPGTYTHVKCHGLWGTYDNGLAWIGRSESSKRPKVVMTLGSSIGNFLRESAGPFLKSFAFGLRPSDIMIVGVDGCDDSAKIHAAYNDSRGTTERFYRNGLKHANHVLDYDLFKDEDWDVIGQVNEKDGLHEAFISPKRDLATKAFTFKAGERIRFENAFKYTPRQQAELWRNSALALRACYTSNDTYHAVNILSPEVMHFDLKPELYAQGPAPSAKEYQEIWKLWDLISLKMLPTKELLSTPIYLRNCCIFYLGHIPTFLDMQISKATGQPATRTDFNDIFERGIDPDVDNPAVCHDHSAIPDTWPELQEILDYQKLVRQRTLKLIEDDTAKHDPTVSKALWLAYEHEGMHLETYLYMLLQSDKIIAPPGARPDFVNLASQSRATSKTDSWVDIPTCEVMLGQDKSSGYWGWDNELPSRKAQVAAFQARQLPITNRDYVKYLISAGKSKVPMTWTTADQPEISNQALLNGHANTEFADLIQSKAVRTVYGLVPLLFALDWPVMGSYDELAACAEHLGGRIPTLAESKSIHAMAERAKSTSKQTTSQEDLFMDLTDSNVGLKNFHPVPVTTNLTAGGIAPMGGAWEWTSTILRKWEGFEPMQEYLAYTADFFDEKHNIVVGGSWATVPRIAGRRSFINWYQRNYPYAWVGARVVRDLPVHDDRY